MTQDEIIEMARQAGFEIDCCSLEWHKRITAFAKLVAAKATAKEREACEKLIEELSNNTEPHKEYEDYDDGWVDACNACKWSVVARGEA
jgi:hypothetical protein